MFSVRTAALLAALIPAAASAQGAQYRPVAGTFALTDCRIETVTNGTIERGTLVVRGGRIEALGANVAAPADAVQVPCNGGTVYPGLFDSGDRVGLQEIGAVETTVDIDEVGEITPQMRALTAVNPSTVHIPVTRLSGVTTVLTFPRGGLLPGTAALIELSGYTPDQMAAGFEGVVLAFPRQGRRGSFDRREQAEVDKASREALAKLDDVWRQATLYARIDSARTAARDASPQPYQPEMAALLPVLRGERTLLVEANAAADIVAALAWLKDKNVRAVLTGVSEGWRVADQIAAAGLPCLVGPVIALPARDADRYDRPFENVGLLAQAGVLVAIRSDEEDNARNLPFHAGFAAAYGQEVGFGPAQALAAVTINPARIFGVADRLGSLEVGKEATLFITAGDPFEARTHVTGLFIRGEQVPLVSRQTELYDEFLRRGAATTP